ncbi:regulator of ribonuclease activity A [Monoraphidium neglectum]|uniref:4-hydroxy-4-methyl-2-oxoglutarate aldolase n=1 Tax=Monoraphidium neglectum TaxID=145388 RepID=A0A0D2M6B3_9CHLO|nr:regulator of ribonuclease activity A [Monoraphidium neglectum]KIY96761.1 regulator of ribonuclease activity A [Monoraphidium neglectum]|eukprot:XP_013895781.1 regulator of ribonuclease activity A [Monoraphidium neglectum]
MPGLAKRRLPRIKPPQAVTGPGGGRVLVVDGGGSTRCALLGDMLAEEARKNGWAGIIVNGCIRDSEGIGQISQLGVKALATCPLKSSKRDLGLEGVTVVIGGCTISPGDWVYADPDGVLVAKEQLTLG